MNTKELLRTLIEKHFNDLEYNGYDADEFALLVILAEKNKLQNTANQMVLDFRIEFNQDLNKTIKKIKDAKKLYENL